MHAFFLLLRVQILALIHSFSPRTRRAGHAIGTALLAVCYVILIVIAAVYLIFVGIMLVSMNLAGTIPALAVLMGSVAGVVFTFLKANGTLFGLVDFDLVMALPIPRRTIVASRVAALYASAAVLGIALAAPLWGVYLVLVDASAWTILCCILSLALAPAAPTAIATFLAFGVAAVSARFRHANLAYIVCALAAFTVLFVGMYGFSFSAQTTGHDAAMAQLEGGLTTASTIATVGWPPAQWLTSACTTGSLPALGLFVLVSCAIPAIALEIMQRNYLAINAALERGRRGRALSTGEVAAQSGATRTPFQALVLKEYRTLLGIPSYAFNCLFGYVLMIVIAVAAGVVGIEGILGMSGIDAGTADPAIASELTAVIANLLPWVFAFCAIASPSAACSVSIEGKAAWICVTAPLPLRTVLGAKLAANALPIAVTLVVSAGILLGTGAADALGALQVIVAAFGAFYLMVNIGLAIDARRPNFAWSSPNEVVKRGMPITVTIIGGMVLIFAGGAGSVVLSAVVAPLWGAVLNLGIGIVGTMVGQLIFARTCRTTSLQLG